ncbi:unnamed protein product [Tuber melanosporum]|uniref:Putative phospholipase n=1 Tax=Tuber melanosporum (strain Mel28) TaxID=656061 RepID=D5G9T6_TUBMM|nr:uncharacterized protein GSTUM_00005064001 [Tuber melanosporum]CAZ81279.1 unnamed protein product [Tuber melanosporum]
MSFLSRLNLIPQFPTYPGPYHVGSFELEIPASSLEPTSKRSPPDTKVETVQFRVFYPAEKPDSANTTGWFGNTAKKSIRWLPEPYQREYLSGYARFMGVSSRFAEIVSYLPRALYYISLPATANAQLLGGKPPEFRFPTMVFSHGLGGTRLAYSHICGSIASYGVIVVAPEHRDGSGPVSFVKVPAMKGARVSGGKSEAGKPDVNESSAKAPVKDTNGRIQVDYRAYPHQVSAETENGRNKQLEIRLWELSLIYSALSKIDIGKVPEDAIMSSDEGEINEGTMSPEAKNLLSTFKGNLDVKDPGKLIWAGHSFGAATMIQFLKSVYYPPPTKPSINPLLALDASLPPNSFDVLPLGKQITATSPLLLLDLWCLPLLGKRTSHLFKQPLPQISNKPNLVLVIMSEEFFRWKENLRGVKRILSPEPGQKRGTPHHEIFEKWDEEDTGDARDTAAHEDMSKHFHPNNDLLSPSISPAVGLSSTPDQGGQIIPPTATPSPTPERQHKHQHHVVKNREPRFYYVRKSAHLSQSDFGILFPVVARHAENPRRILDLNVRATIQWLREAGYSDRLAKTEHLEELVHGLHLNGDDMDKGEESKNREGDWGIWEEGGTGAEGWGRIDLEETDIPEVKI